MKDYSDGYKKGQQDGKNGDNKLIMRSFKRLFTDIGSWLPGFDNRDDQFRAGYIDGLKDKIRIVQTAVTSEMPANPHYDKTILASQPASNGGAMSSSTSFGYQIELLQNLKQYLGDFQERLLGVSANYQRKLDELHDAGMMDETYTRYVENELAQTQALIARLVEHISANDIPNVDKEINYMESH